MHAYHGKDERRIPPLILGHEFSGTSLDGKFKIKKSLSIHLLVVRTVIIANIKESICARKEQ